MESEMIEVCPIDDYITHDSSTMCVCEPEVEFNNEMLIIHKALDGRVDGDNAKWGIFVS